MESFPKIIRLIFLCFLWLLLSGCTGGNRIPSDPLAHFAGLPVNRIQPTKLICLEEFDILRPIRVLRYGDDYIIIDWKDENIINRVNFSTNQFISGVRVGQGPNELIESGSLRKVNDKLLIFDASQQRILKITTTDSLVRIEPFRDINFDTRPFIINFRGNNVDNVIASGLFGNFWIGYIDIVNNELLSSIDFPEFTATNNLRGRGMQKSVLYLSTHTTVSPNGKKMAAATQNAGVISFSHIDATRITEFAQLRYFPPGFREVDERNVAFLRDGKFGFTAMDSDDNYVYVLYSGRTYNNHGALVAHGEHLLVYDWAGNPIRRYILDIPMWSMRFDRETNSIYGIANNSEGMFIRYQLSDTR